MSEESFSQNSRPLGDYRLLRLMAEGHHQRRWLAEQISVGRQVLIDELRPESLAERESFLADVRAKGSVDHPAIGSVFEAVDHQDACYFAHECLAGASLRDRIEANEPLEPGKMVHILRRIVEAQLHLENQTIATVPLGLDSVYVDSHGVVRMENLAVAGQRVSDRSAGDIRHFGMELPALVADGKPGATRLATLLAWMRGEGIPEPLTWQQVREYCIQIEQQLVEPTREISTAASRKNNAPHSKHRLGWAIAGGISAILAVVAAAAMMRGGKRVPAEEPVVLPESVLIPGGRHLSPDGDEVSLESYRISSHEVTIRQYAEFLETLERLGVDGRASIFDADEQPAEKRDHLPDDWQALHAAAKSNSLWRDRTVSLDHPVVGIDWWDAAAYAEWKKGRLPSQEEWFAAMRKEVEIPSAIPSSDWVAVNRKTQDRTPNGLVGIAGSVSEWVGEAALNPANPLGKRRWLLIGGSYLKPGSNALTREWLDERSTRRPDLGFRLVFDVD